MPKLETLIHSMVEPDLITYQTVVALGDIHGDLEALRTLLIAAHLMNKNNQWVGGHTVLVQTGDLVDDGGRAKDDGTCCIVYPTHGDEEIRIFDLLLRLKMQAQKAGGDVRVAIGNHEASAFANPDDHSDNLQPTTNAYYKGKRGQIFAPGGPLAKKLAHLLEVVVVVDNNVFCHGGLLPNHNMQSINHLNHELTLALTGQHQNPHGFFQSLLQQQSPVCLREWGYKGTKSVCHRVSQLRASFDTCLPNARFFIGHTVQEEGINAICDETVYRLDVMLGRAFGPNNKSHLQYAEIVHGAVQIIKLF